MEERKDLSRAWCKSEGAIEGRGVRKNDGEHVMDAPLVGGSVVGLVGLPNHQSSLYSSQKRINKRMSH